MKSITGSDARSYGLLGGYERTVGFQESYLRGMPIRVVQLDCELKPAITVSAKGTTNELFRYSLMSYFD